MAVSRRPSPPEHPAEPPDEYVRQVLQPVGQMLQWAYGKLESEYPGWAGVLATVYEMFDSVLNPEHGGEEPGGEGHGAA